MSLNKENYQDELKDRLTKSAIYNRLCELANEDEGVKSLSTVVFDAARHAVDCIKIVVRHLDEYTLHDDIHLFQVLYHMERLIPNETLNKLGPLELALLVLSAFYHDIGMAPPEREVKIYRNLIEKDDKLTDSELEKKKIFELFCKSKPYLQEKIDEAKNSEDFGRAQILESYRVTEFIRTHHAKNVKNIIQGLERERWSKGFKYKNFNYGNYLAKICESHNESIIEMKNPLISISIIVGNEENLNSLFISIILRLADLLDFDAKRTPDVLFEHLGVKNSISVMEWKKHRSINAWKISPNSIVFSANCDHPATEKAIRTFCDYIDYELITCRSVLEKPINKVFEDERYQLRLPHKVDTSNITAKLDYDGLPVYQYRDLNFVLDQEKIVNLLMGTSLYANAFVTVRELLQNSIDACNVRRIIELSTENNITPQINIRIYKDGDHQYLEFDDTGIGMDEYVINNFFSKVGNSYYKSEVFYKQMGELEVEYKPISKFGIGILSVFMISDLINIQTKKVNEQYDYGEPIDLTIEGLNGFFHFKKGFRKQPGTCIKLKLKKDHGLPIENGDFINLIQDQLSFIDIPIFVNGNKIDTTNRHYENDGRWNTESSDFIKVYEIDLLNESGVDMVLKVALLESNDSFYENVQISSRDVLIDDEETELTESFQSSINQIYRVTDSVDFDENISQGYSISIQTEGKLYINGIRVTDELFSKTDRIFNNYINRVTEQVQFSFPILYKINLTKDWELSLNAARDKIIHDNRWRSFKSFFTRIVLEALLKQFHTIKKVQSFSSAYRLKSHLKSDDLKDNHYNNILDEAVHNRILELEKKVH